MKQKKKGEIDRTIIAQDLARLSGSIADGRLEIAGSLVELGKSGYWKMEKKVKRDAAVIKLEIKLPLSPEAGLAAGVSSRPAGQKPLGKREKRPFKAKKIKKEMGNVWKLIKKNVRQGLPPSDADLKALWRTKEEYEAFVDTTWQKEWEMCIELAKKALSAAEDGNFEEAVSLFNQADKLKGMCHKKYK